MTTLFVEKLINIDFSYFDPKVGLVGETYWCDIELTGQLNQQSMILDFGLVKQHLKNDIENLFDHKLVIPLGSTSEKSKQPSQLKHQQSKPHHQQWTLTLTDKSIISLQSPDIALFTIPAPTVTPKNLEAALLEHLQPILVRDNLQLSLRLYPETHTEPFFHYSHGLHKHQGACQRIVHGHRSRLEIYCNGVRNSALERAWCQKWQNVYIGSTACLRQPDTTNNTALYHFAYDAPEGHYELSLPAHQVALIDGDTTIETISQYVANTVKLTHPDSEIKTKVFEGINKGAIGYA